jgi:hypothetical protein
LFPPTVLINDSRELTSVEDEDNGELYSLLGAGGDGVRGIGEGVRVGTNTWSEVCVDEGELFLRQYVRYASIRREMMQTSLTKLGWTIVQGYDRCITLSER